MFFPCWSPDHFLPAQTSVLVRRGWSYALGKRDYLGAINFKDLKAENSIPCYQTKGRGDHSKYIHALHCSLQIFCTLPSNLISNNLPWYDRNSPLELIGGLWKMSIIIILTFFNDLLSMEWFDEKTSEVITLLSCYDLSHKTASHGTGANSGCALLLVNLWCKIFKIMGKKINT